MGWKYIYVEDEDRLPEDTVPKVTVPKVTVPDTADTGSSFSLPKGTGFDDSAYQAAKPTYTSDYANRIDDLISSLENRPAFSYDAESDPLYQQYRSQYRREGSRAVDDTLASAASMAGGMNSYAVTAAQQAGDHYNSQLMELLPELSRLAYQMYQADYDEDVSNLKLLQSREAESYSRYQDALANWYGELEAAYQQYRDSVADSQWRESFDHNAARDAAEAERWQQEFDYQQAQDAIDNQYRQDAFEYGKTQDALDNQYRQDAFEYGKTQDAIDNQYRQDAFEYGKTQDALDNQYRQDAFEYGKTQDAVDNQYRQDVFEYEKAKDAADPYAGTDYYQQAIDAAQRGDRAGAEAALAKRAEKMASPDYQGNGGGTSMAAAQAYIERLLSETAATEKAAVDYLRDNGYTESEVNGLISEAAWENQRGKYLRTGNGPEEVSAYDTYEDYVEAYIQYLSEQ